MDGMDLVRFPRNIRDPGEVGVTQIEVMPPAHEGSGLWKTTYFVRGSD
jgi:hypothetical protein